jgi:hypothetical protein
MYRPVPFETLATLVLRANGSDCLDWIGEMLTLNYRVRINLQLVIRLFLDLAFLILHIKVELVLPVFVS